MSTNEPTAQDARDVNILTTTYTVDSKPEIATCSLCTRAFRVACSFTTKRTCQTLSSHILTDWPKTDLKSAFEEILTPYFSLRLQVFMGGPLTANMCIFIDLDSLRIFAGPTRQTCRSNTAEKACVRAAYTRRAPGQVSQSNFDVGILEHGCRESVHGFCIHSSETLLTNCNATRFYEQLMNCDSSPAPNSIKSRWKLEGAFRGNTPIDIIECFTKLADTHQGPLIELANTSHRVRVNASIVNSHECTWNVKIQRQV